jgi:Tfp pilus assembly protein PilO
MSNNIEDRSITISFKMIYTFLASMLIGSFSLAGSYFALKQDIKDNRAEMREYKSAQITTDAIQNLGLENMKLNSQKIEIDLQEIKKQLDNKKDK